PPSFLSALIVGYLVTIIWPDEELESRYRAELASLEESADEIKPPSSVVSKAERTRFSFPNR
ncbi:MAG: hypothetical protein VYE56_07090, partial [Pseudomonadota bacterium]|nr:hypothetical protein [Pseudomonadota bacterium]